MDTLTLPLVWKDTLICDAFDRMRQQQRAGVVVEDGDEYELLYAGDLLRARSAGAIRIADCTGAKPVVLLDPGKEASFGLDLVRPRRTGMQYEQMLNVHGFDYALAGATYDSALIVTLHEGQTAALAMIGGYECNGQPTHYFPEPRVSPGETCPLYPECQRTDEQVPTVHPAA